MLFQQLTNIHSFQIEDNRKLLTPSIAVANNNYYHDAVQIVPTEQITTTLSPRRSISSNKISKSDTEGRLLNFCYNYHNNLSQSTQFRFGSSSTLLNKLWYTYSYIYKATATKATFTFYKPILALLFCLLILMPTTSSSLHQPPGIVSPSLNLLLRTRSFNMSNFKAITQLNFIFGPHHSPKYEFLDTALNNVYSKSLDNATLASLFH